MSFPQFHSLGKEKYPHIGKILCNAAHREANQRTLTSSILGLVHILKKIPEKLKDIIWGLLQRITTKRSRSHSPKHTHTKVGPVRELMPLNDTNVQYMRDFRTHQNWIKLGFIKIHPIHPVVYHLARDTRDQKFLKWSIRNQLVLVDLPGWLINPQKYGWFAKFSLALIGAC